MSKKRKILFTVVACLVCSALAVAAGATSSNPTVSTSDLSGILSAVTDQFSVSNITSLRPTRGRQKPQRRR